MESNTREFSTNSLMHPLQSCAVSEQALNSQVRKRIKNAFKQTHTLKYTFLESLAYFHVKGSLVYTRGIIQNVGELHFINERQLLIKL